MQVNLERAAIIKKLKSEDYNFEALCMEVYAYQRKYNPLYAQYCGLLNAPENPGSIKEIPFLPIQFFKSRILKTRSQWEAEAIYASSGTTGMQTSQHHVRSLDLYLENSLRIFQNKYGSIKGYKVLALLPSYLERQNSSLVAMSKYFMEQSGIPGNGFYLNNYKDLIQEIARSKEEDQPCLLIGVTFALLDFPREDPAVFSNTTIIETGGMKGRKQEMTRSEVHKILGEKFGKVAIHSEYGMTELLSQAWSQGNGIFEIPKPMEIFLRELNDPFCQVPYGKTGVINVVDLANIDSCAFIATDDLGIKLNVKTFEVLGRVDGSDIRGCNLMYFPT